MRYLELGVMLSMLAGPVLAERAVMLPYADPAAVAAGEDTYKGHCAACHGADLEGEPNWKVRNPEGYCYLTTGINVSWPQSDCRIVPCR